jgi:hypothetical protein
MLMEIRSAVAIFGLALCLCLLHTDRMAAAPGASPEIAPESSRCVLCHADLKKLIRLCWEVEKIRLRPRASAETSGEG